MGWLPLVIAAIGFVVVFKMAQQAKPVTVEPVGTGDMQAIEFFWRPG